MLKDIHDKFSVELVDYDLAQGIQDKPALAWWAPYVHKKSNIITAKLKNKYIGNAHTDMESESQY